ncbi:hypothetical protein AAFF_G00119010 [Aldrovandia affinis]|uniref:ribonuclease H n=1 Tax=Aldrovandia affinis TaxID=143900 RepID=A0AAD7RV20_9TELE|nr:hypothetical protein AAFF_G00119010 [Aldrovandia affinis]
MVVGWTHAGNFCYVPVALAGAPCSALVDTGSTATLMRPDVVPVGTQLEQTSVQLRTLTGELAPMLGRGKVVITVGGLSVEFRVWVAEVQDPCILGLDFLKFARCLLDLGENTLSFPGGPTVKMISPHFPRAAPFTPGAPLPLAQPNMEADRLAVVRGIWERSCGHLEPEQQEELWQLLTEFKGIFALTDAEIGRTHLVHHQIDTGDARPIRSPPRRLPMAYREAAECTIDEMQHAGIIEPSASPWASGVVMVKKKNTSKMRFCVDYRPLNKVTKKDSYPMPHVDEALDTVAGSSWFSSLDLRAGYWQVPLDPESKPKTAFCTVRGPWQFRVLSFGLCNAPATFERLMESVLIGIPQEECVVYLDDILAHGSSFQAALQTLRRVLGRIAEAGLKLHPDKCHFMRREVEFLGHKLTGEGISTQEEKIRAIKEWPTPTDKEQLESFVGLASYYRRFTSPCRFVLDTDASNVGMGAVLSQVGPEGERAVAYFSHTFNKAERNYCVTRRELLAVIKAVRHFSHRTPRTLSVPEQQQQQVDPVDLTGATRPRRRRRPPGRFEDFV